jgi:putative sugar O-methyltransferase
MIWAGDQAISRLAERAQEEDPAASSHWRKYHAGFDFDGSRFRGIHGFGGTGRTRNPFSSAVHRLLQIPFRAIAKRYQSFPQLDNLANVITRQQNRAYNLDVLRQTITLGFLRDQSPDTFTPEATVCVIGDGFASMTSLLLASESAGKIVLINLSKTLLVDLWYLRRWLGQKAFDDQVALVNDAAGLVEALEQPDIRVISIEAGNHELLVKCPLDAAINIASMQEMDPPVVAAYFDDLRAAGKVRGKPVLFYCCNREEKQLPDGTITRIAEYPWQPDDQTAVDALCPWHHNYYAFKPPFYHRYDGPVRHKLVSLKTTP